MARIATQELNTMRDAVFFDGSELKRRLSRFWILLVLASIIAAAGIVADSTATVIGAMIVAPLMGPIQGTMLAVVLGDRRNLTRSLGLVIAGAFVAVLIGFLLGVVVPNDVVESTNSQVAARVSPGLIDLLAALATGVVGSIALVRSDIADSLPGVAIAISLVPPLSVVGLTLEGGAPGQALGALLLFVTNVAAILATGSIVMAMYGVHRMTPQIGSPSERAVNRRSAMFVIAAMVVVVGVPLTISSVSVIEQRSQEAKVLKATESWVSGGDWEVLSVRSDEDGIVVRVSGPLPSPDTDLLRRSLIVDGVNPNDVTVQLVPLETVDFGEDSGG